MNDTPEFEETESVHLPEPTVVPQEADNTTVDEPEITGGFTNDEETTDPVTQKVHPRNAELYSEVLKERDPKSNDLLIPIVALRETLKDFVELLANYPNLDTDKTEYDRDWRSNLFAGAAACPGEGAFISTANRETAAWRQFVEYDGNKLWASKPVFGSSDSSQKLTGERALIKVVGALGLGTMVQVPLWHSGIWVSLKAPSAANLMILDRQLADEKGVLGRETNGLIYSNRAVYMNKLVLDFIADHVYETNIKDFNPNDKEALYRLIRMTDIPSLVWGFVCTMYPKGYHLQQPCSTGPDRCTHISKLMINLGKIHWVDTTAVTPAMRKHMGNRVAKYTEETILQYQSDREFTEPLVLNDKAKIVFHTPSVQSYIESGYRWITEITGLIDRSFTTTLTDEERDQYLQNQSVLSTLRQYGHWIKSFHLEDDLVIEDTETMEPIISEISLNDTMAERFFAGISKFIDNATMAIVAIPRTNCPACGEPMAEEDKKYPNLLAIDALNVFFTLLAQRLLRIR